MAYDGLNARELGRLTGAVDVILEASIPSTQDVAHRLGEGGAPSGTLVLADEQTAGRGRQGRVWHSPGGRGVWLSLVVRPPAAPSGGALAIRTGLAVVDALAAAAPDVAPRLKWPNDIMVADRKAGGVLCEARWSGEALGWVAVGVGLNVTGPVAAAVRTSAIALSDAAPGVSRLGVLAALVPLLLGLAAQAGELRTGEQERFVRAAWAGPGDDITGIAPDGALLLRGPDGTIVRRTDAA